MRRERLELVLASFLMLFVELVLIRWTGANVTYLSYFSNFVLLGSFLGIGIGFLRAHKGPDLFRWAPAVLAAFTAFVTMFPVVIDRTGSDFVYFGSLDQRGLPAWLMLPLIFVAVATAMTCVAHGVAVRFARFDALEAYRLDILGSLFGILAFALLAWLGTPPLAWGIVIGALFLVLLRTDRTMLPLVALASLVGLFAVGSFRTGDTWSPYYRIFAETGNFADVGQATAITVNGIPHQVIMPTDDRRGFEPSYFIPYERIGDNPLRNVLIVGAGTGSDVAIALREGAEHVDAVEIDPDLQRIGAEMHPDRPYDDPRVDRVVTDGRAFLENTDRTYDLILFALPDSLTLVSGQGGIRLESYLFTRESFDAARSHLAPGGSFAIYNYYREAWLVDRLAGTMDEVFGAPPCVDSEPLMSRTDDIGGLSVLVAAAGGEGLTCTTTWAPAGEVVEPASDDHPFVYLRTRSIPSKYLLTLLLVLAASAVAVRAAGGRYRAMAGAVDLFFMGAAFLLLETKNVVQFALLFGTTWFVNALVFAGILLTVLLAVEVERRIHIGRPGLLYALLFVTLAAAAVVPVESLLALSFPARFAAATALAFAPIFVANLVFAGRFRDAADPTAAFGANLLGAMVGGALEYLSLVTGYRALLFLAAGLYALAWAFGRQKVRQTHPDTESVMVGASSSTES
jgi:hypothetical protein